MNSQHTNSVKRIHLIIYIWLALSALVGAQVKRVINPTIDYSRSPQRYYIGGITVSGVDNYDEYLLVGLSGLSVGQAIDIPGEEISMAVKR